jgi:uncharacterized protein YodC (DUF2158 family)
METRVFDANDLIRLYSPPSLGSVMPGNKVMLKSGGPKMTVCDVDADDRAVCQWLDDDGKLVAHAFELWVLTCWGAE